MQSTYDFVATEKQRANRAHFDATMRHSKQRAQLDLNLAYRGTSCALVSFHFIKWRLPSWENNPPKYRCKAIKVTGVIVCNSSITRFSGFIMIKVLLHFSDSKKGSSFGLKPSNGTRNATPPNGDTAKKLT